MSYPAMAWARTIKTGSATNKSVLLAVANYANEDGICWPSQERLAEDTELSRRSIVRALDDLEAAGHIARERRHRSDGSRKTDLIKLNLCATKSFSENIQCDTAPTQCDTVPNQCDTLSKPKCHNVTAEPFIEPSIEPKKKPINISYDADFDEFWAAYPKRSGNPKKFARLKYMAARKRGVSHETILAGVKAYAKTRENDDPKFTKLAETWLNKECWDNDYSLDGETSGGEPTASDADLDTIVAEYPGIVSDRMAAKKSLAAEIAKGVALTDIATAAKKYRLYVKQMRQDGLDMAAPILETWLRFKWREMDAYVIYSNPVERRPVLRPIKDKGK